MFLGISVMLPSKQQSIGLCFAVELPGEIYASNNSKRKWRQQQHCGKEERKERKERKEKKERERKGRGYQNIVYRITVLSV